MFTPDSRYRRSPVIATVNAAGQQIHAAELRIPPKTPGAFQHRVHEAERIDSLANQYYRDPLAWWRIADANPAFATPDELLGNSRWRTERIAVIPPAGAAPWAQTLAAVAAIAGVARIARAPSYRLITELHTVAGEPVEVVREQIDEAVNVTFHAQVTPPAALAGVLTVAGFTVIGRDAIERTGQPIIIPPERG
jgi:hypothetical protein